MATKILDQLYLGDSLDAEMLQFSNPLNITAVVNVALESDDDISGITNIHVPMEDGNIQAKEFDKALREVADHIQSGRVLLHCLFGASRSVVVLALYLAVTEGTSFDSALKRIKKLRNQKGDPAPETVDSAKHYLEQRRRKLKKSKSGESR
jgi:protein-tyrosine phosphatase